MQLTREDVIRIVRQELADSLRIEVGGSECGTNWRKVIVRLDNQIIASDDFNIVDYTDEYYG